jgi:triacylglycerol lipase
MSRREPGRTAGRLGAWPLRPGLLSGLLALLAAGAVAAGIAAVSSGPAGPARQHPGASRPARQHPGASRPAQDRLGPVVLVPGYGGGTGALDSLAGRLRASGREAIVVHLPGAGTGSLVADAAVLNAAVSRALKHGAPSVDVVGYSAGGVVALIWARRDDGTAKARRVITLGSPFHGTRLAAAAEAFVPGDCPAACRQLIPGNRLLAGLAAATPASLPGWLSLWTADDTTVTPPDSARLAGALNLAVQSLCPAARITHSQLPTSPVVTAIVLQELGRNPLRYPPAADCRA